jgi:hypothetical protein
LKHPINRIKYNLPLLILLLITSCDKDIITVETIEQYRGMITSISNYITTTNGEIVLHNKNKHNIRLTGNIVEIGFKQIEHQHKDNNTVHGKYYYSPTDKRITLYYFYTPLGAIKLDTLNETITVKSFQKFNGLYTANFVYNNSWYAAISKHPEIKLDTLVEDFDIATIITTGITQYKMLRQYIEDPTTDANLINAHYIFPEDLNPNYKKYSLL